MQAPRFLHTLLTSSLPLVHAKRLQALLDTVGALLGERRLGLTALGRALPGPAAPKHAIKRVDRLLGNPHLHQERPLFYWLVASLLIGHMTRPLILVDWSPIDDRGQQFLLRAAVPWRPLPRGKEGVGVVHFVMAADAVDSCIKDCFITDFQPPPSCLMQFPS